MLDNNFTVECFVQLKNISTYISTYKYKPL